MKTLRHVWLLVVAVSVLAAGLLVPALGVADRSWSHPVSLSTPGQDARNPQVGVSSDGRTIATTWYRSDGSEYIVQAKTSTNGGRTWTAHNLTAPGKDAYDPQIAVSGDGKTIATTWYRYLDRTSVVQARTSTDSGRTWTTATNLSDSSRRADAPQIAVSANGNTIATTWKLHNGSKSVVQSKTSTNGGRTWTTTNNQSAPDQDAYNPQVDVSGDGKTIATTWYRYNGSKDTVQAKTSTNSGRTWSSVFNQSAPGKDAYDPQIAVSGDGKTIANTWRRYNGSNSLVQAKTSTNSGRTWTAHNLSDPGKDAYNPRVDVSGDGKTVATTWQRDDGWQLIAQAKTSTNSGRTWSSAINLTTRGRDAELPQVGVSGNGTTIATTWQRNNGSNWIVQAKTSTAPLPPATANYTPLKRNRTKVAWMASSEAIGYKVVINGSTKCTTGRGKSRCTAKKAYGPRANVKVIAIGATGNSPATSAAYRRSRKTIVYGTAHFSHNSAALTKKNKKVVRKRTKALARQGFGTATVFGYTAKERNAKKLSKKRATAVRKEMRKTLRTIKESMRIKTVAKGNKNPIGNNNTKKGRAKNRRATINIR